MGQVLETLQALAKRIDDLPPTTIEEMVTPLTPFVFSSGPQQTHTVTGHFPIYGIPREYSSLPTIFTGSSYRLPSESFCPVKLQQSSLLIHDSPFSHGVTFPYPQPLLPRPFFYTKNYCLSLNRVDKTRNKTKICIRQGITKKESVTTLTQFLYHIHHSCHIWFKTLLQFPSLLSL